MFELLVENDLNYSNLSSFKARDPSLNELLAISPEIYKDTFCRFVGSLAQGANNHVKTKSCIRQLTESSV